MRNCIGLILLVFLFAFGCDDGKGLRYNIKSISKGKQLFISGPKVVKRDTCSDQFDLKLEGIAGTLIETMDVAMSNEQGGKFFSDKSCTSEIEKMSFEGDEKEKAFYVIPQATPEAFYFVMKVSNKIMGDTMHKVDLEGTETDPTVPPESDVDGSAQQVPSGPLSILPIADKNKKVNTGSWPILTEVLEFEIKTQGGQAPLKYEVSTTPQLSTAKIIDNKFYLKPGIFSNGIKTQAGSYQVTIKVTDKTNKTVSTSFKVEVVLIELENYKSLSTQDGTTGMLFELYERLHPDRRYVPAKQIESKNLLSGICRPFTGSDNNIQLQNSINIVSKDPVDSSGAKLHSFNVIIPPAENTEPFNEMVYVFPALLEPQPNTSISSNRPAPSPFFHTFYVRCLESAPSCDNAFTLHGKSNYYYCSDYLPSNKTFADFTNSLYCMQARSSGQTPAECQ